MLHETFYRRMAAWLGPEFTEFRQALEAGYRAGLRVNTLKLSPEEFLRLTPFHLTPVPWCPEGYVLADPAAKPSLHPFYAAGLYYLQDPAAMAAAVMLDPRPGEWVLDLCAAPGGKATHLAARMANTGILVANDVSPRRASVLAMNLERLGVTNALVLNESPRGLVKRWAGLFDRVLVDAPCSGEANLARDPAALRHWSTDLLERFGRRQLAILTEAAALVRPGGRLLYATCSFSPEENELVISRFLSGHPEFDIVEGPLNHLFDSGHPEWLEGIDARLQRAVRLWPHREPGHGHFYALLQRRRRRGRAVPPQRVGSEVGLAKELRRLYDEFCSNNLKATPARERLMEWNGQVYQVPAPSAVWQGLRVLRPGWWLGRIRKGRFEPDHALAMGLKADQARQVWHLPVESRELKAYLRGEELEGQWQAGWVLVAVEGFPVGWARAEGGRLKSLYPRHLRAAWWRLELPAEAHAMLM